MGFVVASLAAGRLRLEAGTLVQSVVQLGVDGRQLEAAHEQVRPFAQASALAVPFHQRADDQRHIHQESGALQLRLNVLAAQLVQQLVVGHLAHLGVLFVGPGPQLAQVQRVKIQARFLTQRGHEVQALKRQAEIQLAALIGDFLAAARDFLHQAVQHPLHQFHHVVVVAIGEIGFQHGEFGVVGTVNALVAVVAPDFVHPLEAAHQQPLEVQLQANTQAEIVAQRLVVRLERGGLGAARHGLQGGAFHFHKALAVQEVADVADGLRAGAERFAALGVHDQVKVAAAGTQLLVLQAAELGRQRVQALDQRLPLGHVQGQLAGLGDEGIALYADDVTQVNLLGGGETF